MSIAEGDSSLHGSSGALFPVGNSPDQPSSAQQRRSAIWLNGDVLSCACPQCGAPMTVRLWLRLAECWRCDTAIELTEEQQQAAIRLLEARGREVAPPGNSRWADPVETDSASTVTVVSVPRESATEVEAAPVQTSPAAAQPPPLPQRSPVEPPPRCEDAARRSLIYSWLKDWFREPVPWLVSLILHMVLILLLGAWLIHEDLASRPLLLALERAGDQSDADLLSEVDTGPEFEVPKHGDLADEAPVESNHNLETAALELPEVPPLTDMAEAASGLAPNLLQGGPPEIGQMLSGRDPGARAHLVAREGGSTRSEEAVELGLKWLAKHQNRNGSWSLDRFHETGECNGQCSSQGRVRCDAAGTALALLPFLGAGHTHLRGDYRDTVGRGLQWLLDHQKSDGDLRAGGGGRMYTHGLASIVLCESYSMTRHEMLKDPAQRAINFIVAAQHNRGGWRYRPGESGDTSVVGWQLMALRSGQMAYLEVPDRCFTQAMKFLDSVSEPSYRGRHSYMPHGTPTDAMTAEGLLCRQYGGWQRDHPAMLDGIEWLLTEHPPAPGQDIYYWYYATQAMHHQGGDSWKRWNSQLRDRLIDMQVTKGHEAGSWTPVHGHDPAGGRLYMTALAICTLEVYYRHLPLYGLSAVAD